MTPEQRLHWIGASNDSQELAKRYDAWAQDYDRDLASGLCYLAPSIAVQRFARWVPCDARILDAGAGTGLVGEALYRTGYRDLVALDYSAGMLEQAARKGVYCELSQQSLSDRLLFDASSFDAVISVGVFSYGYTPPMSAFDELIRITRRGGIIFFITMESFYRSGPIRPHLENLERAGVWTLEELGEPFCVRDEVAAADATGVSLAYRIT